MFDHSHTYSETDLQLKLQNSKPLTKLAHPQGEAALLQEYFQLCLFFILLGLLLAVFSFHPLDPSDLVKVYSFSNHPTEVRNIFGPLGANVAGWMFECLGILAPVTLVVGALQTIDSLLLRKQSIGLFFRLFGLCQFVFFASAFLALALGQVHYGGLEGATLPAGGWSGEQTLAWLQASLGMQGSLFISLAGIVTALPMVAGLRLMTLLRWTLGRIPLGPVQEFFSALHSNESPAVAPQPKFQTISREPAPKAEKTSSTTIMPRYEFLPAKTLNSTELIGQLKNHKTEGQDSRRAEEKIRLVEEAQTLIEKLETFGVSGRVVRSQPGPVVNVHEFEPAPGIKVGKVIGLQEDLALGLKARSVLMAPQSGKSTIGIELPAHFREVVSLKEVICSQDFQSSDKPLTMVLGKTVEGSPLVADLSSMPHLLIAGATGAGKSVAINVILLSLLLSRRPDELRLILVDPKMLELSNYDGIGHLLLPVVTAPEKAAGALRWAIAEMDRRYALLKDNQVRNIESFNGLESTKETGTSLPYIVVVIDELCDLMMTAPKEVEDSVQRLAQKARASGIHLILATQRPSVDVLTGVIKANLPCRISFQVASKHDSRTIIESMGAEKLLGKGDMLYLPPGTSKLMRAHGAFVSDQEVNDVCRALRETYPARYETGVMDLVDQASTTISESAKKSQSNGDDPNLLSEDELYTRAVEFAFDAGKVSTSSIQRQFRIGYNKAARLMDRMDQEGLVGPSDTAGKPREVKGHR